MKAGAAFLLLALVPLAPLLAQTATLPGATTTTPASTSTTTPGTTTPSTSTSTPAAAANPAKPDLSIPADKKDTWVVGFCAFNAERLPAEDQYLTYSIPQMLKNQLAGLTSHTLSDAERKQLRKNLVSHELDTVDQNISGFFKERDALFLNSFGPDVPSTETVDDKIRAALARKDFLKTLDLNLIKVAEQKTLEVKEGTGVGKLFDALSIPASVFCERQGIDLLVGGMVREVEGYILLDIWAYDATTRTVEVSFRDAALKEEVYQSVPQAGTELTGLFLGKPWATISFLPDPPQSSLYVNGKLVATGRTPVLYLAPGTVEITVSAPGYRDLTQTMTLSADQDSSLAVTLEKKEAGTVLITSTPSGADVYVESVWKGRTPLALEKPYDRTRVDITQKGYYDMPFSVSESSPSEMGFVLQPDAVSRDALQKQARDQFYNSFALFVVSVPIPLFSYAFALNSSVQTNELVAQGNTAQALSAQARTSVYYDIYIAGTVVSAALFTWMIIRIIHYVSVSTRTAG